MTLRFLGETTGKHFLETFNQRAEKDWSTVYHSDSNVILSIVSSRTLLKVFGIFTFSFLTYKVGIVTPTL